MLGTLLGVSTWPLGLFDALGTAQLGVLTLASFKKEAVSKARTQSLGRIAYVVPAHNEEHGLHQCLFALQAATKADTASDVWVIADNCTDSTADIARSRGVNVIERKDLERRGKGHALYDAFAQVLANKEISAICVVDADSRVEPNFAQVVRARFESGAEALQTRYLLTSQEGSLADLAAWGFNVIRPRGRERLGLSVGILGNGFALTRKTLERVPYQAGSVVEDLEYHLMLVRAGIRVEFVEETGVWADPPSNEKGQTTQRRRWEGGRLTIAKRELPSLLKEVLQGNLRLLEPTLDLMLMPLGYHVALSAVCSMSPSAWVRAVGNVSLLTVGAHILAAASAKGDPAAAALALSKGPTYILKKLRALPDTLRASRSDTWVRTTRDSEVKS